VNVCAAMCSEPPSLEASFTSGAPFDFVLSEMKLTPSTNECRKARYSTYYYISKHKVCLNIDNVSSCH
jgi:hypothetical protein